MNSPSIELRNLAYFIAACQNPTISETARELGIAPSALSVGLHALENNLKMKLFLRRGNYLYPLPSTFWLFEQAVGALRAEQRLRETSGRPDAPLERLQIHLNLSFTIGLFSKAINRTIAELAMTVLISTSILDFFRRSCPAAPISRSPPPNLRTTPP